MKRRIVAACFFVLILSLTGCGQAKADSAEQLLSGELSGEVTVSCYETMLYKDFLEKAAKSFEGKNPGTKINVESFAKMPEIKTSQSDEGTISVVSKEDDSQERSDYISKINTELMSGGGADVLAIDILPYYKYADSGLLEDLQDYMDADSSFDIGDYRKNIIQAVKYRGGQYMLPLDYMFDYVAYDSSLFTDEEKKKLESENVWITYEKMFDVAKEAFERENGSGGPVRMIGAPADYVMLKEMMLPEFKDFVDIENRKVSLNDGRFAALMESVKKYGDLGYLQKSLGSEVPDMDDIEKLRQEKFFYKVKGQHSLRADIIRNEGLNDGNFSFGLGNMSSGDENDDKILGLLSDGNGKVPFNYLQAYGINANSDNKALAWAFVKYLMSEEIQSDPELMVVGLPINNEARMEKAKMMFTGNDTGEDSMESESAEAEKKAEDRYIEMLERFSDSLNYCPIRDDTADGMIKDEVNRYFDGRKSAEEAAGALQEKLELYLNE